MLLALGHGHGHSLMCFLRCHCRQTDAPESSVDLKGGLGNISFLGISYTGVYVSRRGTSSLTWKKPKLKFKMPPGVVRSVTLAHPCGLAEGCCYAKYRQLHPGGNCMAATVLLPWLADV